MTRSDTSLQLDVVEAAGDRPRLVVRMFVKGTEEVIGEATFYAETAARFAAEVCKRTAALAPAARGPVPATHILVLGEVHADGSQTSRSWQVTAERAAELAAEMGEAHTEVVASAEQSIQMQENAFGLATVLVREE